MAAEPAEPADVAVPADVDAATDANVGMGTRAVALGSVVEREAHSKKAAASTTASRTPASDAISKKSVTDVAT